MGVQVHKRVRLAIRLDEVQRQQTKEKAEHTWRKRSADEVSLQALMLFTGISLTTCCGYAPLCMLPVVCAPLRLWNTGLAVSYVAHVQHLVAM